MSIPSLIFLWHGLAVTLEPVAEKEWNASERLAARHDIDINRPPPSVAVVPAERNFLGHPYFQQLINQSPTAKPDQAAVIHQIIKPHLPSNPDAGDTGQNVDLLGVMESLDSELPILLEKAEPSESLGGNLLNVMDQAGVPWEELIGATARPSSQFPPMGSTPPVEDFYAPANSLTIAPALVHFMGLAQMRTYAALEAGNHRVARESLLLQMRVIDGYLDGRNLLYFIFANGYLGPVLNQVREGMSKNLWHPADLDWLAGWVERSQIEPRLTEVLKTELFGGLREIDFIEKNPAAADHQHAALTDGLADKLLPGNIGAPFSQDWLLPLRGQSEWLYRSVPPAVFLLWKAHTVRTVYKKELQPLVKSGLLGLVSPDEPDPYGAAPLSMENLALGFNKNKARMQLFMTSRALAQWHATHQDYPADLERLDIALFPNSTPEPFGTGPLKYERLSPSAYRLYSLGADFQDQGGEPITEADEGDICWHRMEHPEPGGPPLEKENRSGAGF